MSVATFFRQQGCFRVASSLLVVIPGATSSVLVTSSNGLQPNSDGLQLTSILLLDSFYVWSDSDVGSSSESNIEGLWICILL